MRAVSFVSAAAFAAVFTGATAQFNQKVCGGSGGCVQVTWFPNAAYSCPDGSALTNQQVAQNLGDMNTGNYDIITKTEFPASCAGGRTPGPNDTPFIPSILDSRHPNTFHSSRPNLLRRPSKVRNIVRHIVGVAQRVLVVVRRIEDFL